jgi:putative oxidoreductase
MVAKLLRTNDDCVLVAARLVLGIVFFIHGSQKVLGWFGGHTFNETMTVFTDTMHIPAPLAFLAIAAEFGGGIALVLGLLGRVAALGIICVMVVAIVKVHFQNGFFMNWGNVPGKPEGYEYHLLAIALALVILVKGSGALSIDRLLTPSRALPPPSK